MTNEDVLLYCNQLTKMGINHQILKHPTLKDKVDVLNCLHLTFADCIPTLIMKADDKFIAIVIRGDCKVDFKKVKKEFNIKNLRLATPEEFTSITRLRVGAARIYIPGVNMTLIDNKVFEKEYLAGGSGSFDCSINYNTSDLRKLPNSFINDITQFL